MTKKTLERIIIKQRKEDFYRYYRSLGYGDKVAASLALFTYGQYRFTDFSIDDLYEALCRGEEYIPQEVIEERIRLEKEVALERRRIRAERSRRHASIAGSMASSGASMAPSGACRLKEYDDGVMECSNLSISSELVCESIIPDYLRRADFATDEYEPIEEKNARTAVSEQTSTFRMTTNTASAGVVLNQLRNERRIDRSMVRIEEMLNYFRYESEIPEEEIFRISSEIMDADDEKKYLYINVQGREEVKDRQNIIILLDVSGSMSCETEQTQAIIATIISKLGNGDKLSLITYSDEDIVEMEAFTINGSEDRVRALEKLLSIEITGCTNGSAGIERAYQIGKKNYIEGGNNQVILITDGDLNFGITDRGGLEELIEKKKQDKLFLSVIGTGLYNFKDDKLETLSKHGNGVYRVVNNLADVSKSIDEEYSSLVNIIAKDVKAQVEFNPEVVESYRLLGFENREISREDFTDDTVISEPFGSGGYGVALYELKMRTGDAPVESGLKYSRVVTTGSQEPCTVKVRYKQPLEDASEEIEKVLETAEEFCSDNLRLAFIVYVCAEKLRGSDKISKDEIELAKEMYQQLGEPIREKNTADLYKLAGILDKSEEELGIGIQSEERFRW